MHIIRSHLQDLYEMILAIQEARIRCDQNRTSPVEEMAFDTYRNVPSNVDLICRYAPEASRPQVISDWGVQLYDSFP